MSERLSALRNFVADINASGLLSPRFNPLYSAQDEAACRKHAEHWPNIPNMPSAMCRAAVAMCVAGVTDDAFYS